jgi:hypothetical protein
MIQSNEALELLKRIDARQDKLITLLIGDLDKENPRARLPVLEASVDKHDARIDNLEDAKTKIITFSTIASFVIMALGRFLWPSSGH